MSTSGHEKIDVTHDRAHWLDRFRLSRSLSAKIAAGFFAVLVLHASIAILAHVGLDKAQDDTARFDAGRRLAQRMTEIDRKVGELQWQVQAFTHSGNRSLLDRIERDHATLLDELTWAQEHTVGADEREETEAMISSLSRYAEQFQLAVLDRQQRKEIVDESMMSLTTRGSEVFVRLVEAVQDLADASVVATVARAQQSFTAAEAGARTYIHTLDSSVTRRSAERLDECRETLGGLTTLDVEGVDGALRDADEILDEMHRLLVRLVQTTRGYLHLINVVMAGEAAEFRRSSQRIRHAHTVRLDELSARIVSDQESFQWTSAIISVITILMGFLASSAIGRVVVDPLRRITHTLTRLARGDETASISDRDRGDEIGAMAEAAQVFRDRNLETARMLSDIRELASKHERTIADLENTNRDLDNFAHVASHDLKAPLRAMGVLAQWIEEDGGEALTPDARQHLATLRLRVRRMARLLDDLMAYAKAGRADVTLERVNVFEAAEEAAALVEAPDGFTIEITGDRPAIRTPRVAFMQVLNNLVSNAIKHHDGNEGRIGIEIVDHDDSIAVTVRDDGPGIEAKLQERIFEPFETLKSRDEFEASGVGLALVKKVLDRYGGTIRVESAAGRGAAFHVLWPRDAGTAPEIHTPVEGELIHA